MDPPFDIGREYENKSSDDGSASMTMSMMKLGMLVGEPD